ncbi:hypothetical protein LZ30DRAFT_42268 [Colletotrichum cereale]|nr:hypothetical protein LZ30DRAFT_42268 [Colletotrichum cereale]
MCLGAVVVLRAMACNPPAVVAMVLSNDTSCFVACSPIFRGQSPPVATSRPSGCRINAEDDIVPKVTSASASGRGSINLVLFSKISFSLLLMFFFRQWWLCGRCGYSGSTEGFGRMFSLLFSFEFSQ